MSEPTPPPQEQTPATLRVAIELGFVAGCARCAAIVDRYSAAAVRDRQVTRFVAVPGSKHAHETDGNFKVLGAAAKSSDATTGPLEGQEPLFPAPASGMNGFDAAMRE